MASLAMHDRSCSMACINERHFDQYDAQSAAGPASCCCRNTDDQRLPFTEHRSRINGFVDVHTSFIMACSWGKRTLTFSSGYRTIIV